MISNSHGSADDNFPTDLNVKTFCPARVLFPSSRELEALDASLLMFFMREYLALVKVKVDSETKPCALITFAVDEAHLIRRNQ